MLERTGAIFNRHAALLNFPNPATAWVHVRIVRRPAQKYLAAPESGGLGLLGDHRRSAGLPVVGVGSVLALEMPAEERRFDRGQAGGQLE